MIQYISYTLTVMISLAFLSGCSSGKKIQQSATLEKTTVYDAATLGYTNTRIPALVMTKKQTLLAFIEARTGSGNDWVPIDILLRRSTDGGKTWEAPIVIAERKIGEPCSNTTPIVDADGTIHVLYQRNYRNCYYIQSVDDGKTWTSPKDITYAFDDFKKEYNWKVLAPGPGHGIQLRSGRLLVPIWLCIPNPAIRGGDHRPSCVATVYSDDRGLNWKRGSIVVNTNDSVINPSENMPVELADGTVMLNIRSEGKDHRRLVAVSPDGISHWTVPKPDTALFDPVCMASIIRLSTTSNSDKNRILFVNPDSRNNPGELKNGNNFRVRENLSVKISYDEGKTWPVNKVVEAGGAGYSDLATGKDGTIYLLYEIPGKKANWGAKVLLARFSLGWLTDNKDISIIRN
jgi:sialidase-1